MNRMGTRSMPRRPDHAGFDSPEHIAYDMLVFVSAFAGWLRSGALDRRRETSHAGRWLVDDADRAWGVNEDSVNGP